MVASKGGIKLETALAMTRGELTEWSMALALAHGGEVDWRSLRVSPPKPVQQAVLRSVT